MKSEDIARYVAGLEGEVERLRAAHSDHLDKVNLESENERLGDLVDDLTAERDRLRAAQPALPDVGEVSWHQAGTLAIDMGHGNDWYWRPEMIDGHEHSALQELAAVRAARAFLDEDACPECARPGARNGHEVNDFDTEVHQLVGETGFHASVVRTVLDAHRAARTSEEVTP